MLDRRTGRHVLIEIDSSMGQGMDENFEVLSKRSHWLKFHNCFLGIGLSGDISFFVITYYRERERKKKGRKKGDLTDRQTDNEWDSEWKQEGIRERKRGRKVGQTD